MAHTPITSLTLRGFGPIIDGTLALTPLHALIGPNDSGKSMTLAAVQQVLAELRSPLPVAPAFRWAVRFADGLDTDSDLSDRPLFRNAEAIGARLPAPPRLLRLDPDELRQPQPLLREDETFDFKSPRGLGLGSLIDALFARDAAKHQEFTRALTDRFASAAGFRLYTSDGGRQVGVRLKDGTEVRPEHLSEGLLYFLAFAMLRYLRPTPLLLIEEPENGLHPARIGEVMSILREVSRTTQVLLATHSPLVINELEPHEVTLVTRDQERGTQYKLLADTPFVKERLTAFSLGELWIAYANGIDEQDLLHPKRAQGA